MATATVVDTVVMVVTVVMAVMVAMAMGAVKNLRNHKIFFLQFLHSIINSFFQILNAMHLSANL